VCSRAEAVPAPEGLSAEDAAAIGTAGLTAIQSLQPYVKEGSNVFINGGSGGVGLFGIQIAKVLGCHVTVTCSSANIDLCKSVGADRAIDYRTSDVVEELEKSDRQYDLFLDYVGTKQLYWAMKKYTNPNARCVQVATDTTLADIVDVFCRLLTPSFIAGPGRKLTYLFCKNDPENLSTIGQWVKEGKVRVITDEVFAYEDAPKAFARLKTHRARGKVVITSGA
jgi:NADPH:quinone reductase-like Zn-dependent oxidoreductase